MKTAVGCRSTLPAMGWVASVLVAVIGPGPVAAASADYFLDEADRSPGEFHLDGAAERKADALAHFVTGVLAEENSGPEQALANYRQALALDPGFTKLAIEVAYDYLRRGDPTEAIGVLKDAFKAAPHDPEPALALGSIYLRHLRKPDLASRYAEAALKVAPDRFAPYEALWEIAVAQDDRTTAARVISRALRAKATDAGYWLQVADFLTNAATQGEAFTLDEKTRAQLGTCLERAAAGAGKDASTLARIGDFHALCRDFDAAAGFYGQAADLRPSLPNINERLASTLIELGRTAAAIPVLQRIIAANPLDLAAYDQLYRLYQAEGDLPRALKNLEQAIIIDRTNLERQRDLMVLLLQSGRFEDAATRATEAATIFPRVPFFLYVEARSLAALHRYPESLAAYERAALLAAGDDGSLLNSMFYFDYGCTAQLAGRNVKAAELFRKAIELDPKNADALNALGYMWAEHGENLDEAERMIRRALAIDPANGAYLDSLGWVHYQRGDYALAVEELLRAAQAMPGPDPVVHEHIGDAYFALNRPAEALLHWQKAAGLDSANKTLAAKIDAVVSRVAEKNQ